MCFERDEEEVLEREGGKNSTAVVAILVELQGHANNVSACRLHVKEEGLDLLELAAQVVV